jgi:hypothetical protein
MSTSFPTESELGGPPNVVVVLVHGTFSDGDPWCRPNSELVRTIQDRFHDKRVLFHSFRWRGFFGTRLNNSHFYRYTASERLSASLRQLHDSFPLAQIFVVAHSHGGNVALYAARKCSKQVPLGGIVCLGTPFIRIIPRAADEDVVLMSTMTIAASVLWLALIVLSEVVAVALGLVGVFFLVQPGIGNRLLGALGLLIAIPIGLWYVKPEGFRMVWVPGSSHTAYGLSASSPGRYKMQVNWVLSDAAKALWQSWTDGLITLAESFVENRQRHLAAKLNAISPDAIPLLCFRTATPDEALAFLRVIDRILGLPKRLLTSPTVANAIANCLLGITVLAGIGLSVWLCIAYIRDASKVDLMTVVWMLIMGSITAVFTIMALSLLTATILIIAAPLSLLLRAPASLPAFLAYGSASILGELFSSTSVGDEPLPPETGAAGLVEIKNDYSFGEVSGLKHCAYYSDPTVLHAMSEWMLARA